MVDPLFYGIPGATLILIGFFLELFEYVHSYSKNYIIINFVGSALLVYYAYLLSSIPFFILNFIWALASLDKLWQVISGKRRKKRS